MAATDLDDLISTMKGGLPIGQEAMDLRALHDHFSQTLYLPPQRSAQPTPVLSCSNDFNPFFAPASSFSETSHALSPTSSSFHASEHQSQSDPASPSITQHSLSTTNLASLDHNTAVRRPVLKRSFSSSSSTSSRRVRLRTSLSCSSRIHPYNHHSSPTLLSPAIADDLYASFFSPPCPSSNESSTTSHYIPPTETLPPIPTTSSPSSLRLIGPPSRREEPKGKEKETTVGSEEEKEPKRLINGRGKPDKGA